MRQDVHAPDRAKAWLLTQSPPSTQPQRASEAHFEHRPQAQGEARQHDVARQIAWQPPLLQRFLHEVAPTPESYAYQSCAEIQHISAVSDHRNQPETAVSKNSPSSQCSSGHSGALNAQARQHIALASNIEACEHAAPPVTANAWHDEHMLRSCNASESGACAAKQANAVKSISPDLVSKASEGSWHLSGSGSGSAVPSASPSLHALHGTSDMAPPATKRRQKQHLHNEHTCSKENSAEQLPLRLRFSALGPAGLRDVLPQDSLIVDVSQTCDVLTSPAILKAAANGHDSRQRRPLKAHWPGIFDSAAYTTAGCASLSWHCSMHASLGFRTSEILVVLFSMQISSLCAVPCGRVHTVGL